MEEEILLTAEDVARRLQVSRSFAYQMMRRDEIRAIRLGRSRRVRPEDLERFIESKACDIENRCGILRVGK